MSSSESAMTRLSPGWLHRLQTTQKRPRAKRGLLSCRVLSNSLRSSYSDSTNMGSQ